MPRLAPRVKIHRDGTCTVSGVPYDDMRSILTAAFLDQHRGKSERLKRPDRPEIQQENDIWYRRIAVIITALETVMNEAIQGPRRRYPRTVKQRWEDVRSDKKSRLWIRDLLAAKKEQ